MADQKKTVIADKVQNNSSTKFKVKAHKNSEVDVDIEIMDAGDYQVDKLSVDDLPATMNNGAPIKWFNNFAIKHQKSGQYINQKYKITIAGLTALLGNLRLVIFDGNGNPYYYTGAIVNDTFEMTDGDPGIGGGI
jgi:hypothetical protein